MARTARSPSARVPQWERRRRPGMSDPLELTYFEKRQKPVGPCEWVDDPEEALAEVRARIADARQRAARERTGCGRVELPLECSTTGHLPSRMTAGRHLHRSWGQRPEGLLGQLADQLFVHDPEAAECQPCTTELFEQLGDDGALAAVALLAGGFDLEGAVALSEELTRRGGGW